MKKILSVIILSMMLMSMVAVVSAEEVTLTDKDFELGDSDFNQNIEEMSWWSKLKFYFSGGQAFTVIGGATCETNPAPDGSIDIHADSIGLLTGEYCYQNNDHTGVAFQMFKVTSSGWNFMGEKQLTKGQTGCFQVEFGTAYHADLYYCDSTLERTCSDTDGGRDYLELLQ